MLLKVKLEVVSRPGVRFSDCNATRLDAIHSTNPSIVRFDVVKKKSHFDVAKDLQKFYQAEILIPSPIPPHLIDFPSKPVKLSGKTKVPSKDSMPTPVIEVSKIVSEQGNILLHNKATMKLGDIALKLSEPKSVETKGAVLCEGGSSDILCHTLLSTTSSQATVVVGKVETPLYSMVLGVLADQGVGEPSVHPLSEVRDCARLEVETKVCPNRNKRIVNFIGWVISVLLLEFRN
jgi:hypothetical protein